MAVKPPIKSRVLKNDWRARIEENKVKRGEGVPFGPQPYQGGRTPKDVKPTVIKKRVNTNREGGTILQMQQARRAKPGSAERQYHNKNGTATKHVPRTVPSKQATQRERDEYLARRQGNKVRGREEAIRIAKERKKNGQGTPQSKPRSQGKPTQSATTSGSSGTTISTSGRSGNTASTTTRKPLEPGGRPTESMWQQTTESAKYMGKNFKTGVDEKYGGSYLKAIGTPALKGAVWGGVAGGTISAAQGGDFWSGAKQGAFNGAAFGAGIRGAKLATNSDRTLDVWKNGKEVWNHHSVSKPVQALDQLQQNAANVLR